MRAVRRGCPGTNRGLIVVGGYPWRLQGPDYPWGIARRERLRFIQHVENDWGGALPVPEFDRIPATLMITGIVGAASTAVQLGDDA